MLLCASLETDVGKKYPVKKADSGGPQVPWAGDGVGGKVCLFAKATGGSQCSPRETAKTSALVSG